MGKYDPMFTGNLKIAWDNWFSKKPKLIMFLCGSVSSWIDKYILTSTGFVGRPTMRMDLRELSMSSQAPLAEKDCRTWTQWGQQPESVRKKGV